jgi:hypothetical protein
MRFNMELDVQGGEWATSKDMNMKNEREPEEGDGKSMSREP